MIGANATHVEQHRLARLKLCLDFSAEAVRDAEMVEARTE